jgi:hypothetical protein
VVSNLGEGSVACEGKVEEMATVAREDGVHSQERKPRGCEHYDRGCLLKVTTSKGSSPTSFRRGRLGAEGAGG